MEKSTLPLYIAIVHLVHFTIVDSFSSWSVIIFTFFISFFLRGSYNYSAGIWLGLLQTCPAVSPRLGPAR